MEERFEWVEIVEPRSQEHMYANLITGECAWHPPTGVKIKKTSDIENQWWELFDKKTSRCYYYNASSQKTVWHQPQTGDIIPLTKLQTLKTNTDIGDGLDDGDNSPFPTRIPTVHREVSTQTATTPKKDTTTTSSRHRQSTAVNTGSKTVSTTSGRSSASVQTNDGQHSSPQQSRKQQQQQQQQGRHHSNHGGRRTHPTPMDRYRADSVDVLDSSGGCGELPSSQLPRDDIKLAIGSSRTTENTRHKSSSKPALVQSSGLPEVSSGRSVAAAPSTGPQRSLESPQSRQNFYQNIPRDIAIGDPASQMAANAAATRPNHFPNPVSLSAGNYFHRQDSCPVGREPPMRASDYLTGGGGVGTQYQDVSQITAVQVTPRPKPRAFPRTNPSFCGSSQRRDQTSSGLRQLDKVPAAVAFNQSYQLRHGEAINQPGSRYYPNAIGSQTLQASHSFYSAGAAAGDVTGSRRSPAVDQNSDSDDSSRSSSSSSDMMGGANQAGIRRQHTLDSRPVSRYVANNRPGTNTSFHITSSARPATAVASSSRRKDLEQYDVALQSDRSHVEPPPHNEVQTRAERHGHRIPTESQQGKQDPPPPRNSIVVANGSSVGGLQSTASMLHPSMRRNSEPDYVNVPQSSMVRQMAQHTSASPRDFGGATSTGSPDISSRKMAESRKNVPAAAAAGNDPVDPKQKVENGGRETPQGGGTLRMRDNISLPDYVNSEELRGGVGNNSIYYNVSQLNQNDHRENLSNSVSDTDHLTADQTTPTGFAPETHHQSLRRRKWIDKPGSSIASSGGNTTTSSTTSSTSKIPGGSSQQPTRQSTLEKTLSLQAELTQHHRPLSMVVPFSGGGGLEAGNSIVNQVADTLLHQMDIERFLTENLNEHRKGLLGKTVPVGSMLIWTKDAIQKPMIRTENKLVKKEALEVFKLIQMYMGDRKLTTKDVPMSSVAFDIISRGSVIDELRDEIFIQICRQTMRNPRDESLLHGWELLAICLSFFPPSVKFQSYLEGHIFRCLDSRDHTENGLMHHFAATCLKRLERIIERPALPTPTVEEIEHSKKTMLQPSMFGGTLEEIMDLQKERFPNSRLPWIQTVLSEELLKLCGSQLTEGIFRVPGDSDEVATLKAQCDQWIVPRTVNDDGTNMDPHIVASLLKLWYRELHEPLIPQEFYAACVDAYSNPQAAVDIVRQLPELNRLVLVYLIHFLQKFASPENAAVTKMDANNLAMVMAPNCLRCDSDNPQVMFDNARKEMGFIRSLIYNLDTSEISGVV